MLVKIYESTKIYIITPALVETGGPEALHQLAYHLRNDLKIKTYMYYYPSNILNPISQAYAKYNNPFVREIEDLAQNIVITPEAYDSLVLLQKFKKIRKIIWWLSIDNFYISLYLKKNLVIYFFRIINKMFKSIYLMPPFDIYNLIFNKCKNFNLKKISLLKNIVLHLTQSKYAFDYLCQKGIENVIYLSEYLNEEFLEKETDTTKKQDIVIYNPQKGFKFTEKLTSFTPGIRFIPIRNMAREEVIKLLQKAKVYIDFGNFPGKDRIPREAATLKCCIITGKRGSAGYKEDLNIPEKYKFEDKIKNIPAIIKKIEDCFLDYESKVKDFDGYIDIIKKEKQKFINDLKKIFD